MFKIYDNLEHHMCDTCSNSVRMIQAGKERHWCTSLPSNMAELRGRVTQCDRYHSNKDARAIEEFQNIGWQLDKGDNGHIYWRTPADRHRRRRANPSRTSVSSIPSSVQ